MTEIPATGRRFSRDPKTGALTPLPDDAGEQAVTPEPASDTPEPPADPHPVKSKGKA